MIDKFFSQERDRYLKTLKQAICESNCSTYSDEYSELIDEWKLSSEKAHFSALTALGEDARDLDVFKNVFGLTKYKLAYLDDVTTRKEARPLLHGLRCALSGQSSFCFPGKRRRFSA